jgi:TetR/AcrR family transcriptional repressor of nem operon
MSTATPSTQKGRSTRRRIVQAAAELVSQRGVADVSLDDVGERASASRSQLYHYFEDRDDLIRAAVVATSDAVLDAQAELFSRLDTWEGIEAWMDALVELQVQRGARGGCPLGTLAGQLAERDPQARESIGAGLGLWQQRIESGLAALRSSGGLGPKADPAQLAKATIALVQGGLLLTQVNRDPLELREALDAALRLLRSEG